MRFIENYYNGSSERIIHRNVKLIFQKKTKFQKVQIWELEKYGRALVLDGEIQSAVNDEFIYHESLVHPAMCYHPEPYNILILGGGEGATLREVLKYPVEKVVMVDIDEELIKICKEYLPAMNGTAFQDKRVNLIFEDALRYLAYNEQIYDVIIGDLSNPISTIAQKVWSEEFFALVARRLHSNGIFITQAQTLSEIEYSSHLCYRKMIEKHFSFVYSYRVFIPSYHQSHGFIFATNDKHNNPLSLRRMVEFKYYNPKMHASMFTFSPFLETELGQRKIVSTLPY